MADYTEEPWTVAKMPSEAECRFRGDWIMLNADDFFRAVACVDACEGVPAEKLKRGLVKKLLGG